MQKRPLVHSHSNMNVFATCPRQYHQVELTQTYKKTYGTQAKAGDGMHGAFETALRMGMDELSPKYKKNQTAQWAWKRIHAMAARLGEHELHPEYSLGVTKDGSPCEFFDDDVFFRGRIDLALVGRTNCYVADLKNGKSAYMKPDQLRRSAYLLFRNHPTLENIVAEFLWTAEGKRDTFVFYRNDNNQKVEGATLQELHEELHYEISIINRCKDADSWPPIRTGLCRAHCPVLTCPNCGR